MLRWLIEHSKWVLNTRGAWTNTNPSDASTPAVEAPKTRANWAAIEAGNASGGVPQKGTWYDSFEIGTDTDTDIDIRANNGDANNPFIRYDASENKWVYSNDGSTTSDFGVVPSNAVILYIGTSCPTGYTDITATYEDRYIMADSLTSAAISTGGSATSAHTHGAGSFVVSPDTNTIAGGAPNYTAWSTSGTKAVTGTSASDSTAITPKYAGMRLCQRD